MLSQFCAFMSTISSPILGISLPLQLPKAIVQPNPSHCSEMNSNILLLGTFYGNGGCFRRNHSFIIINSPISRLSRQEEPPGKDLHVLRSIWLGHMQTLNKMIISDIYHPINFHFLNYICKICCNCPIPYSTQCHLAQNHLLPNFNPRDPESLIQLSLSQPMSVNKEP